MRPNVKIVKGEGRLGGVVQNDDSTCLLVITAPASYNLNGSKKMLVQSLKDAEGFGATEINDITNKALVWEHIKDFYVNAQVGTKLHVLLLEDTVNMEDIFTSSSPAYRILQDYLTETKGKIKQTAIALNPATDDDGNGITDDLKKAIPLASAMSQVEFDAFRPNLFLLEGRNFSGVTGLAEDLRALNSPFVACCISRDQGRANTLSVTRPTAEKYAQIGYLLGVVASLPVQRSIARVRNGALLGINQATLSGGQICNDADYNNLHDKGYIFYLIHMGRPGWYYNDSNCTEKITDDYRQIELARVINKASRIARRVFLEELNNEVRVDPNTGQLDLLYIKSLQSMIDSAIHYEMIDYEEIIEVSIYIDPAQNVLTTSKLDVDINIVPFGIARNFKVTVNLSNPAK